jgi:hypothetical protein
MWRLQGGVETLNNDKVLVLLMAVKPGLPVVAHCGPGGVDEAR